MSGDLSPFNDKFTVLFYLLMFLQTLILEVMAPVIVASQQQFGFSHIASPSTAFGKVNGNLRLYAIFHFTTIEHIASPCH